MPMHSPRLVFVLRVLHLLFRELMGGQLNLRAMSLVYTTLLSIVPLLAVSFSVLKGFGVHNSLEPVLAEFGQAFGRYVRRLRNARKLTQEMIAERA